MPSSQRSGIGTTFTIDRKIFTSDIWFSSPWKLKVWIYLIGKANHQDRYIQGILVKRGQLIRSYRTIVKDCAYKIGYRTKKPSVETVRRICENLTKEERIRQRRVQIGTLFTIINYNGFQPHSKLRSRQRTDTKLDNNKTMAGHSQELKELKELKEQIHVVFGYWKSTLNHPKAKLTKDRETKIRARLIEDYLVQDLKKTIDGCKASSYHMGDNDQGKIYDSIELLFRNGDKVEQFWGYLKTKQEKSVYQVQLNKAKAELGKLAGKDRILKWLLILPGKAHSELKKHLDKIYRQGHSYAEAKDEWDMRNRSPP